MTDEGLIEKEIEYRDSGPNRHNYRITDAGRGEFLSWLAGDQGEGRAFRYEMIRKDEFLNKAMYFKYLDNDEASEKIKGQIRECESTLEDFNNAYRDMTERNMDSLNLIVLKYCIMNQETRLNWLKELLKFFSDKSGK
jgi:DNA-binding PadR family transcriptional regulator